MNAVRYFFSHFSQEIHFGSKLLMQNKTAADDRYVDKARQTLL
jgi:hypothetical protein